MSSSLDFIEFVCEQINGVGDIRYRKMFGDYMVYVDDKPILLVCDNVVYIKKLECVDKYSCEIGIPYNGAKEHYILDVDNCELCKEIIMKVYPFISVPRKKLKKDKK